MKKKLFEIYCQKDTAYITTMRTYCLACRKHTNKVIRNKNKIKKWSVIL